MELASDLGCLSQLFVITFSPLLACQVWHITGKLLLQASPCGSPTLAGTSWGAGVSHEYQGWGLNEG